VYMVTISSDGKIVVWDLRVEVMDQVAVYSTGERLNVVSTVQESVEKASTMKPIYNPDEASKDVATDSEYESDGESLAHIMKGGKRKSKKKQRQAKKKLLEVEVE
jgi:protein MAK11